MHTTDDEINIARRHRFGATASDLCRPGRVAVEQEGDPAEDEDSLMRHLQQDEQAESWAMRWALRIFFGLALLLLLALLFAPLVLGILDAPAP